MFELKRVQTNRRGIRMYMEKSSAFIPQVGPIIDLPYTFYTYNEYIRSTNHVSSFLFLFFCAFVSRVRSDLLCVRFFAEKEWVYEFYINEHDVI